MSKIRSFDEKYIKKFLIREGAENLLALRMQKITVEDHMSRLYGPTVVAHETMNQVGCRDSTYSGQSGKSSHLRAAKEPSKK